MVLLLSIVYGREECGVRLDGGPFVRLFEAEGRCCFCSTGAYSVVEVGRAVCSVLGGGRGFLRLRRLGGLCRGNFLRSGRSVVVRRPTSSNVRDCLSRNVRRLVLRLARGYGLEYGCYMCSKDCGGHMRAGGEVAFRVTGRTVSCCCLRDQTTSIIHVKLCNKRPLLRFSLVGGVARCYRGVFTKGRLEVGVAAGTALLGRGVISFLRGRGFSLVVDLSNPRSIRGGDEMFTSGDRKAFSIVVRGVRVVRGLCPRCLSGVDFGTIVSRRGSFTYDDGFFACSFLGSTIIATTKIDSESSIRRMSLHRAFCVGCGCRLFGDFVICTNRLSGGCVSGLVISRGKLLVDSVRSEIAGPCHEGKVYRPGNPYVTKCGELFMAIRKGFCPYREMDRAGRICYVKSVGDKVRAGGMLHLLGAKGLARARYGGY